MLPEAAVAAAYAEMTWLEHEAFDAMYERAGFMSTDDGALTLMAGSTLGGGKEHGLTQTRQVSLA